MRGQQGAVAQTGGKPAVSTPSGRGRVIRSENKGIARLHPVVE